MQFSFRAPTIACFDPYHLWISTALCSGSILYQHKTNPDNIICDNCYLQTDENARGNYTHKIRHYIHIGIPDCHDRCILCDVLLATTRSISECDLCSHIFPQFLYYIERSGDTPYELDRATIVALEQNTV